MKTLAIRLLSPDRYALTTGADTALFDSQTVATLNCDDASTLRTWLWGQLYAANALRPEAGVLACHCPLSVLAELANQYNERLDVASLRHAASKDSFELRRQVPESAEWVALREGLLALAVHWSDPTNLDASMLEALLREGRVHHARELLNANIGRDASWELWAAEVEVAAKNENAALEHLWKFLDIQATLDQPEWESICSILAQAQMLPQGESLLLHPLCESGRRQLQAHATAYPELQRHLTQPWLRWATANRKPLAAAALVVLALAAFPELLLLAGLAGLAAQLYRWKSRRKKRVDDAG